MFHFVCLSGMMVVHRAGLFVLFFAKNVLFVNIIANNPCYLLDCLEVFVPL